MTFTDMVLIGVALFAVLGAVGAFTIAFRRSQGEDESDPLAGVSAETLAADKSLVGVDVTPIEVEVEVEEPEPVEEDLVAVGVDAEPIPAQLVESQRVVEVSAEESGVSRRQFFNRAIFGTFFAFLGMQGIYYLAFIWPKLSGGFGTDVDAGALTDVANLVRAPDGSILPLFVPEARAYVVPAPTTLSEEFAGKGVEVEGLMALFQRCVHLGCRVPWCGPSQGFECPCHGSKYNSIGEYFAGPAPRNLDRFEVEIRNGRFIIRTGSILQTPRAPALSVNYPQGPSCIGAIAAPEGA